MQPAHLPLTRLVCKLVLFACFCSQQALAQLPDTLFRNAHIVGAQWTIQDHGKKSNYHFGLRQEGEAGAITDSTIFQAASLGKVVLAYITLRFIDSGIINADTPLCSYFKYDRIQNDPSAKRITARMVLHHTSGFPNWAGNPLSKGWYKAPLSTEFSPGTAWQYSGEGFMYLQFALEACCKKPLVQIAREEVFEPMKMMHSSFVWKDGFATDAAWGHNKDGTATERGEFFLPAAAFSLLTTANDYTNFLMNFAGGTGLKKITQAMLLTDTVAVMPPTHRPSAAAAHIAWGPGVGIQYNEHGPALWHWGDNGDYKGFFMIVPGMQKSIVYFANSANGLTILPQLLNFYFGPQQWWSIRWLNE